VDLVKENVLTRIGRPRRYQYAQKRPPPWLVACKDDLIVLQKTSKTKNLLSFTGCWKGYPEDLEEIMKQMRKM
jgi:hypothetical protein